MEKKCVSCKLVYTEEKAKFCIQCGHPLTCDISMDYFCQVNQSWLGKNNGQNPLGVKPFFLFHS